MTAPSIREALRSLIRAYVNLLESGRDRIVSLGGECDPVDKMEANDPALIAAKAALSAPPQDVVEGITTREMIARVLYRSRSLFDDTTVDLHFKWFARQDPDADGLRLSIIHCYRDADAILASGLVTAAHPDEAAIRADERERCAQAVHSAVAMIPMGQVDASEFLDAIEDAIAAAIRAGGVK